MHNKIKKALTKELEGLIRRIDKTYSLKDLSPILSKEIKGFIQTKGKMLRPTLFVIGYRGYARTAAANLYRTALSLELLHDFLLIHDDIIDKSDTRRGRPSMHKRLQTHVATKGHAKFSGEDLAIVVGDIVYAIALDLFLAIREKPARKEAALRNFLQNTIYTGAGEFVELLAGMKPLERTTKNDIFKVYDLKTAFYTFAGPLSTGALLAGAPRSEITRLSRAAMQLGQAFQIKDDILGMFAEEDKTGKSSLTDLREGRKTILVWYAYRNAKKSEKVYIRRVLAKKRATRRDLTKMRALLVASGALDYATNEVARLTRHALRSLETSKMKSASKASLIAYCKELLLVR